MCLKQLEPASRGSDGRLIFLKWTTMNTLSQRSEDRKEVEELMNAICPPIPPDPLIEIAKDVKSGFDFARRSLQSINRLRKEIAKLNRTILDLQNRQEYLEKFLIQRSN